MSLKHPLKTAVKVFNLFLGEAGVYAHRRSRAWQTRGRTEGRNVFVAEEAASAGTPLRSQIAGEVLGFGCGVLLIIGVFGSRNKVLPRVVFRLISQARRLTQRRKLLSGGTSSLGILAAAVEKPGAVATDRELGHASGRLELLHGAMVFEPFVRHTANTVSGHDIAEAVLGNVGFVLASHVLRWTGHVIGLLLLCLLVEVLVQWNTCISTHVSDEECESASE